MIAAGCGTDEEAADDAATPPAEAALTLVTGVYPLEWLAQEIGGDSVAVVQLTEPGAEPHDLELTGRQIAEVSEADIAFYIEGLQPAVDEAVDQEAAETALNVADIVELRPAADAHGHDEDDDHGHDHDHDHGHEDEDDEHAEEDGHDHDHGDYDPHFWLDVELMTETAEALAERMGEVNPDGADQYQEGAERVAAELATIGEAYESGLASCEHREVVVGHTAFTYLTEQYGLEQIGVSGVDPDTEPSPRRSRRSPTSSTSATSARSSPNP